MAKLLKMELVEEKVGFKRAKIYLMIKNGRFPKPEKIGSSSRWDEEEVDRWITEQGWKKTASD
ncbi:AlpA family transcriptional regulator [Pseudogulbenkiania sp. MAI-1]|uniref:helix-turn-helix transcriptional regulator n=1 Tax=Pseudogulbenkiania sp. MAI-1 TaxID=990370 RepID=UPI00045E8498|nr:AlpA family phage regulatory protein [Pseudogulbenkiania sp. MAI-1]